jgi:3-deoxy-7-phosphoheptulonate synthase
MHGNGFTAPTGQKTRHFDDVMREIEGYFAAHEACGTWPGGVHVELTGDNVTECVGGADNILDEQLTDRYQTVCDPRLNARQGLDLAFHVAESLRSSGLA